MIPETEDLVDIEIEDEVEPSKTYKMDLAKGTVIGFTDRLSAIKQAIFKILSTERYKNIIYSWDYGIEIEDLYGKPFPYVCVELERRISEALTQDERVESVDNFSFNRIKRGRINVTFTVHTAYGDIKTEKAVNVDV